MRLLRRMILFVLPILLAVFSILAPLAEAAKPVPPGTPGPSGLKSAPHLGGLRIAPSDTMSHTYYLPLLWGGKITRILFIGDSFTWSLDGYFPSLAGSAVSPQSVLNEVIWHGGYSLEDNYTPDNLDIIASGNWDYVVLQDDLADHWSARAEFPIYAKKFYDAIKPTGAKTILYMTWQYEDSNSPTTAQIEKMYNDEGAALGVPVSPVGLAFANARADWPSLELFRSDGLHGNADGFYLVMCTLFASIFGKTPVGATYHLEDVTADDWQGQWWQIPDGWTMPYSESSFLQQEAWQTVSTFTATGSAAPVSVSQQ
jgi:hypothetical protein